MEIYYLCTQLQLLCEVEDGSSTEVGSRPSLRNLEELIGHMRRLARYNKNFLQEKKLNKLLNANK